jgi:hypothetical protein
MRTFVKFQNPECISREKRKWRPLWNCRGPACADVRPLPVALTVSKPATVFTPPQFKLVIYLKVKSRPRPIESPSHCAPGLRRPFDRGGEECGDAFMTAPAVTSPYSLLL